MIKRSLHIDIQDNNAFFLWGPRKTGKTTLLKQQFPKAKRYDLLDAVLLNRLRLNPNELKEEVLAQKNELVIIDEVQKLPKLLDVVHWCLENTSTKFILCGSSARKLKRGAANLLGGRAWRYELFSLTTNELNTNDLTRILNHGLIPQHYLSNKPEKFLEAYVADYINEEIQAEALIRNVPSFYSFLKALSFSHGELINYANIARDCGVSSKTVKTYFEITEETLLGHRLPAWRKNKTRKLIETDKFYLFDVGVVRALNDMNIVQPKTTEYGNAFEHFLIEEVRAYLSYYSKKKNLTYWRTTNGLEVDLIIGDAEVAIEFKATQRLRPEHFKGLKAFSNEQVVKSLFLVCQIESPRLIDNIMVLPWQEFCKRLWEHQIVL